MSDTKPSGHEQAAPRAGSGGPSDAEIRAAAEIAGGHRVSETDGVADAEAASAARGRMADRPSMGLWEALYERRTTRKFDSARPVPH